LPRANAPAHFGGGEEEESFITLTPGLPLAQDVARCRVQGGIHQSLRYSLLEVKKKKKKKKNIYSFGKSGRILPSNLGMN
jgi:hypothetical protein